MATHQVWVYGEQEVATLRLMGMVEEAWAAMAWALIDQDQVSAASFAGLMMASTSQWLIPPKLPKWGRYPHSSFL